MSKLYKVAKMFQKKLSLAAANNLQNLTSVYQASQALGKTKKLWAASGADPYGDTDPEIENAIDTIVGVGRKGYYQATTQGMPVKGPYGYAGFLSNMNQGIKILEDQGPFAKLDPQASSALSGLKMALEKARSEFVPIGIPSPAQHINIPEETIQATPPGKPTGAAYEAGIDPALNKVVEDLVNKNYPKDMKRDWGGFFER